MMNFSSALTPPSLDEIGVLIAALGLFLGAIATFTAMRTWNKPPTRTAVSTADEPRPGGSTRVVILYSSIGYGHISAARAIQEEIRRQSETAEVLLQDVREFMHPVWRRIDERLYWFVAGHLPETFNTLFRSMQSRGSRTLSLGSLPNDYPEEKVLSYLKSQAPDAVLATHYGAAQVLGTLRQQGRLPDVRVGWLHTDFFEGYFPRISKRIDRTFLAHPELRMRWLRAGVPPDKLVTSGMPVRTAPIGAESPHETLARLALEPDVPTLLLTGGKQGAGDYCDVIRSVVRRWAGSVQVIAVCGTNARQQTMLAQLKEELPARASLRIFGLVPQTEMWAYMRAADVLLTKAGGMTPAEAFALGLPTVLLDVISGHERENAALFVRQGLAKLASCSENAGKLVAQLLSDPAQRDDMRRAQHALRESTDVASIATFALDGAFEPALPAPDYGVENGTPALGIEEALGQLDAEAPAQVELLLSYATSQTPQRVVVENPFGHIAIRVDGTVYSANYIADPAVDRSLLQHLNLADYLYGTQRPSPSQVHTNTYGMAYGRETLGLRVSGIPATRRAAMVADASRIEHAFRNEELHWSSDGFNCAHAVARILAAGGYATCSFYERVGLPYFPLDLFEAARAQFEKEASLQSDLVAYRLLPGTQASYRFSRFPLSVGQPLRSIARVLSDVPRDALEKAASRQVTGYFGDPRLYVEDLRTESSASATKVDRSLGRAEPRLEPALRTDLRHLFAAYVEPLEK